MKGVQPLLITVPYRLQIHNAFLRDPYNDTHDTMPSYYHQNGIK